MKYKVLPKKYHCGYCPTICESLESAQQQREYWERVTGFAWMIVEYDEQGEVREFMKYCKD